MQRLPYAANVCDEAGNTALHLAARSNSADALRLLISEQPLRCCLLQNSNGMTPLGVALELKYEACVRALIPAITHVASPINRAQVVECDLVPMVQSYAELATELFNAMGLCYLAAINLWMQACFSKHCKELPRVNSSRLRMKNRQLSS